LKREPWKADAERIAESIAQGQLECLVAATTVTNLFYVARRVIGREAALTLVQRCLSSFEVWPVDSMALNGALALAGGDFEDNVQIVIAQNASSDCIVTRDPKGFQYAQVHVMSPTDFVASLRPPTP
jgi:hypothetical protein